MNEQEQTQEETIEATVAEAQPVADDDAVVEAEAEVIEPPQEQDPLAELSAERDALRDQLLRARAEFDNYRKRVSRDMDQLRKTAAESLIRDMLPVVDNLERALSHAEEKDNPLVQGVDMVMKQFANVLTGRGLEPLPALGVVFDPNVHEALAYQPSDEHAENTVMLEYERGYKLGDQVIRPAKVVVSSGPAATENPG